MNPMGTAKFKAEGLALTDEVQLRNEPILITEKGKPTVVLSPAPAAGDPLAMYKIGGGQIVGDLVAPVTDENDWEYD